MVRLELVLAGGGGRGTGRSKWSEVEDHRYPLGSHAGGQEEPHWTFLDSQPGDIRTKEMHSKAALASMTFFILFKYRYDFCWKTIHLFVFLFCLDQEFMSIWPNSKCAKKNNGSPWIPWFGWNWLQWWHIRKYCYLEVMLSGDSAFSYMGYSLCSSLYVLNSPSHIRTWHPVGQTKYGFGVSWTKKWIPLTSNCVWAWVRFNLTEPPIPNLFHCCQNYSLKTFIKCLQIVSTFIELLMHVINPIHLVFFVAMEQPAFLAPISGWTEGWPS